MAWFRKKKKPELENVDWEAVAQNITKMVAPTYTNVFGNDSSNTSGDFYNPTYLLGLNTEQMQRKALEICWKSVHARGAIKQKGVLTVNSGLRLQSSPARKTLGISPERAASVSEMIEEGFGLFWQQKEVSYDGMDNGPELEALARASYDLFGEVFAIFRYSPKSDRMNPLNIQVISPLSVKNPPSAKMNIKEGIKYKNGKPVSAFVETFSDTGVSKFEEIPFVGPKSGKRLMVHQFTKDTPEQKRGIPMFAPIFHELERIQAALRAEMDTMSTNSSVAGVIERELPVIDPEKIKQLIAGAGSVGGAGSVSLPSKTADDNLADKKKVDVRGGGHILQNFEPGEKLKEFDTKRPNINIPDFILKEMDVIGPSIGLSREVWLMLFGKAYAASKGSIDLTWKALDQTNFHFSSGFNQLALEAFAGGEVAAGRFILPGWSDVRTRSAYMRTKWFGQAKPSLNPYQEANAAVLRKNENLSNDELESQMLTGTSHTDNVERNAAGQRLEEELGVSATPDPVEPTDDTAANPQPTAMGAEFLGEFDERDIT